MFGATARSIDAFAFVDRPATTPLAIAVIAVIAGWLHHYWVERSTQAPVIEPSGDKRPVAIDGVTETPAVVALLTNGFRVPRSAITATAIDLAARGWIRIAVVDDELAVITKGQGVAGDSLRAYEQQVLNHLSSRSFNGVVSAGSLAISQRRLDRRWRLRFGHSVADHAQALGLSERRYTPVQVAPSAAAAAIAFIGWMYSITRATDVPLDESWRPRVIALLALAAIALLVWATIDRATGSDQIPTEDGLHRAGLWMGYRRRLRARIPATATVLAPSPQQSALAIACVMGVAEQVHEQLPIAAEDPRWAWSEAGSRPRVVRVHYPIRPGYGQHPLKVAGVGLVVLLGARWLRGFFQRLADGDTLESWLDRVPGQLDLIQSIARVLSVLCWLPMIWAAWMVIAGAIDSIATRERVGLVVRTRRPSDVVPYSQAFKPFSDRDRYSTYLAVDDGRHWAVGAWLASERTAAPQGAQARVRATPLLGFVRSSEPIGTATKRDR